MAAPTESEDHKAWREATERAKQWRGDFAAALVHFFDNGQGERQSEELAKAFADRMSEIRAAWAHEDGQIIEPPYLTPADSIEGELPGHVPGNPGDPFARRPAYNPHT